MGFGLLDQIEELTDVPNLGILGAQLGVLRLMVGLLEIQLRVLESGFELIK